MLRFVSRSNRRLGVYCASTPTGKRPTVSGSFHANLLDDDTTGNEANLRWKPRAQVQAQARRAGTGPGIGDAAVVGGDRRNKRSRRVTGQSEIEELQNLPDENGERGGTEGGASDLMPWSFSSSLKLRAQA